MCTGEHSGRENPCTTHHNTLPLEHPAGIEPAAPTWKEGRLTVTPWMRASHTLYYVDVPYSNLAQQREYQRNWIAARRDAWLMEHGPCVSCGSTENLEIDHVDRETKRFSPREIWSRTEATRLDELAKCQVLCQSCHWKKNGDEERQAAHGNTTMYNTHGCRCALCKEAKAAYMREYRSRTSRGIRTHDVTLAR